MIDLAYAEKLLPILRANGVSHFKMAEFEISFGQLPTSAVQTPLPASNSLDPIVDALKKHEESLPPDLRADDLMNADKILNWSSPDATEAELPLAPDAQL